MGNTKLYAFEGEADLLPFPFDPGALRYELEAETRGYVTLQIETGGYLGFGKPWLFGAVHSHSLIATEGLRACLGRWCSNFRYFYADMEQLAFNGGLHFGDEQGEREYGV